MTPQDLLKRPLRNLRLSVTDRCNLRCGYCMPEENYAWLPHQDILSFEEMGRLVEIFSRLGVDKVRLTGGEPLLRRDLPVLIDIVANIPAIRDIALTTNGVLLVDQAQALRDAGLRRLTVSLDTLRRERFQQMTRRDDLPRVLAGIEAGRNANFDALKLDTVAVKGQNDDEIVDMVAFAREIGAEVRFIEYMDVGGATQWSPAKVISRDEILALIGAAYGKPEPLPKTDWAPANRYRLPDGSVFGVIASTTAPFCQSCDRSRLTADGLFYLCLYAPKGFDLRAPLREESDDAVIEALIRSIWTQRDNRGAEERAALSDRSRMLAKEDLRSDPHLEMHTRGG